MSNEDDRWDDVDDEPGDEYLDDDATSTAKCPLCGADVYEDAEYCAACDNYITPTRNAFADRPWWWIALGLAGVVALLAFLFGLLP